MVINGLRAMDIAAVALANRSARTIWAVLVHDRECKTGYAAV